MPANKKLVFLAADVLAVARLALGSVRIALQKIDLKASTDLPFSDVEAIAKGEGWYMLQENQVRFVHSARCPTGLQS